MCLVCLPQVRFEVVTSEASYCRSLDIVVEHFVKSKQLGALLTTQDRNWLFSRLSDVRAISHRSDVKTFFFFFYYGEIIQLVFLICPVFCRSWRSDWSLTSCTLRCVTSSLDTVSASKWFTCPTSPTNPTRTPPTRDSCKLLGSPDAPPDVSGLFSSGSLLIDSFCLFLQE